MRKIKLKEKYISTMKSVERFEYCDIDSKVPVLSKVLCHGGLKY